MADTVVANKKAMVIETRAAVNKLLPRYELIRDVIEQNVDELGEKYLPCPSGKALSNRTPEEIIRYRNYVMRAIFYNFLARTLVGFVGQVFSREPSVKNPASLAAMVKDATGDGLSLEQLAKEACAEVLSVGRYGLFVDYPTLGPSGASKAQVDDGTARPVIMPYKAEAIIDWEYKKVGAKWVLCYVVLKEEYNHRDKESGRLEVRTQYRVLDIGENNFYRQRVWRDEVSDDSPAGWVTDMESQPIANGKSLEEIPFTFIGSVNNDANPDFPPMYDMAKINIGHYRNSADYEESIFYIGQPTFVVTGLTESWYDKMLNKIIRFGSREGIHLNKDAGAQILQAEANTMAKEGMDSKKEQLASMGAEFLRESNTQKTATEAAINDSSRTSALSTAAKNVSAAFTFAMEWAAIFQGEAENTVEFKLNSEFDLARMTESERKQLLTEYQANVISWTELRAALHKAGIATEDDQTVKKEVEQKEASELERAAKEFAINNPEVPPADNE